MHAQDKDGNWHAGAIAVLVDNVSISTAFSASGHVGVSVNFDISYFSPAKFHVYIITVRLYSTSLHPSLLNTPSPLSPFVVHI